MSVRMPRPLFVGFAIVVAVAMVVFGGQMIAESGVALYRRGRQRLWIMRKGPEWRRAADCDRYNKGDHQAQSCERLTGRHRGSPKQPAS